jgi:hypothetical protein
MEQHQQHFFDIQQLYGIKGLNPKLSVFDIIPDIMKFIAFCSPIIIPLSLFVFSIYLNLANKGLLYLALILGILCVRLTFITLSGGNGVGKNIFRPNKCNEIPLFSGNNLTLSTYIISFTFFYLCFPMFVSDSINIGIITVILFYLIFDFIIKYFLGCFVDPTTFFKYVFADFVGGSFFGISISCLMFYFGGQNLLLLTETQSDKVSCSRPSNQTFKCNVYKNGTLIQSNNTTN